LLEPYGMGNPVPKLLIKNCFFKDIKNRNIQDFKGKTVQYIRTKFSLIDPTSAKAFPGIWWGHYEHELPRVTCDAIVELDFNSYDKKFEVRLVEVRPAAVASIVDSHRQVQPNVIDSHSERLRQRQQPLQVLDFRQAKVDGSSIDPEPIVWVDECPSNWNQLHTYCRKAMLTKSKLALNYQSIDLLNSSEILTQLIGAGKYLAASHDSIDLERLRAKLNISDRSLRLGLDVLVEIGFDVSLQNETKILTIGSNDRVSNLSSSELYSLFTVRQFWSAIDEERFKRNYFLQIPVYAIESSLSA
jgi:single-stranded-DNA-specific exonuclease